jgi:hypothetical protein
LKGWAARNILSVPLAIYVLQTRLGVPARRLIVLWIPSLVATALMIGTLGLMNHEGNSLVRLVVMIGAASLVYVVALVVFTCVGRPKMLVRSQEVS